MTDYFTQRKVNKIVFLQLLHFKGELKRNMINLLDNLLSKYPFLPCLHLIIIFTIITIIIKTNMR